MFKHFATILLLIFTTGSLAFGSATRTIDGDSITSSDKTKTYNLPTASGTLLGAGSFAQETPSGTVNGSNTAFTLANTPGAAGTVLLSLDGVSLIQGTDYTISSATITMTTAPALGQKLYVYYTK